MQLLFRFILMNSVTRVIIIFKLNWVFFKQEQNINTDNRRQQKNSGTQMK